MGRFVSNYGILIYSLPTIYNSFFSFDDISIAVYIGTDMDVSND